MSNLAKYQKLVITNNDEMTTALEAIKEINKDTKEIEKKHKEQLEQAKATVKTIKETMEQELAPYLETKEKLNTLVKEYTTNKLKEQETPKQIEINGKTIEVEQTESKIKGLRKIEKWVITPNSNIPKAPTITINNIQLNIYNLDLSTIELTIKNLEEAQVLDDEFLEKLKALGIDARKEVSYVPSGK